MQERSGTFFGVVLSVVLTVLTRRVRTVSGRAGVAWVQWFLAQHLGMKPQTP